MLSGQRFGAGLAWRMTRNNPRLTDTLQMPVKVFLQGPAWTLIESWRHVGKLEGTGNKHHLASDTPGGGMQTESFVLNHAD